MERRDFFEKTGCGVVGLALACFRLKLPKVQGMCVCKACPLFGRKIFKNIK